jgi:hypothetical protein
MAKVTPKSKASKAMSRYIRLRDALSYCKEHGIDLSQFARPEDIIGQCCTCGGVKSWIRLDAGHWKGRGIGGGSGVYFDERNVDLQCKRCNGFLGGMVEAHEEYIAKKRGRDIVDEIARLHYGRIDMKSLAMQAMEIHYKEKYTELLKEI